MNDYYTPPPAVSDVWLANPEMTVAEAVFYVMNNGVTYEN